MVTYNAYFAIVLIPKKYMGLSSLLPDKQIQESKKKKQKTFFLAEKLQFPAFGVHRVCMCAASVFDCVWPCKCFVFCLDEPPQHHSLSAPGLSPEDLQKAQFGQKLQPLTVSWLHLTKHTLRTWTHVKCKEVFRDDTFQGIQVLVSVCFILLMWTETRLCSRSGRWQVSTRSPFLNR